MDGRVLGKRGADVLQFGFLLKARDGDATPLPGGDALLQGGVVEIAAAPQDDFKRPLLCGVGRSFSLYVLRTVSLHACFCFLVLFFVLLRVFS